jgi:hypothetical protein
MQEKPDSELQDELPHVAESPEVSHRQTSLARTSGLSRGRAGSCPQHPPHFRYPDDGGGEGCIRFMAAASLLSLLWRYLSRFLFSMQNCLCNPYSICGTLLSKSTTSQIMHRILSNNMQFCHLFIVILSPQYLFHKYRKLRTFFFPLLKITFLSHSKLK